MTHLPPPTVVLAAIGQAAMALYIWRLGPLGPVPMHIGLNGEVDRWGDRTEAALVIGGIALVTLLAGWLQDVSIRLHAHDESKRRGLAWAQGLLVATTTAVCALMLALSHVGPDTSALAGKFVLVGICALLAGIGAFLGKIGPNAFVGVRTPWSLTSRLSWEKTHRLAGRLFFWGGLAGLVIVAVAPETIAHWFLGIGITLATVACVVESWRVWRADPERNVV